jgi:hypothetical protein
VIRRKPFSLSGLGIDMVGEPLLSLRFGSDMASLESVPCCPVIDLVVELQEFEELMLKLEKFQPSNSLIPNARRITR